MDRHCSVRSVQDPTACLSRDEDRTKRERLDGEAALPPGFCAQWFARNYVTPERATNAKNNMRNEITARSMVVLHEDGGGGGGAVLVLDRSVGVGRGFAKEFLDNSFILLLRDADGDGVTDATHVIAEGIFTHGLEVGGGFLYASSDTTVWRWPWSATSFDGVPLRTDEAQVVVRDMNADGKGGAPLGHTTRTLILDEGAQVLYVSVGSGVNVDPDSERSRVRRFPVGATIPPLGFKFREGEVFADGLRNTVSMAFDARGRLWGGDNSADELERADLGRGLFQDNPADELNLLTGTSDMHFGYPVR